MSDGWIRTSDLCRFYRGGGGEVRALDSVDIDIARGEFVAICGASGSGKSTLLNLLAGLDTPTSGSVTVAGMDLGGLSRGELSHFRSSTVGIVFQAFHLIPHMTAAENVELALCFAGVPRHERTARAADVLGRLGLSERTTHKPGDLSGGEQQRVALARALATDPDVLFADEPTGNLDRENTDRIATILERIHREGRTVVMSTHDTVLAGRCASRLIHLSYGRVDKAAAGAEDFR